MPNHDQVCRFFADCIDSDVYLEYRIELARNGMVDGLASKLPVSERLTRLRQHSINFRNGSFDFEDPRTAHPDYVHQLRNLHWSGGTSTEGVKSVLYINTETCNCFLSIFTDGSKQAGIASRCSLMPIGSSGDQTRMMSGWIIDRAQDLLVTIEHVTTDTNLRFFEVRFCSWSGSQSTPMDHPAATLPCIQVSPLPGSSNDPSQGIHVYSLIVEGSYAIWKVEGIVDQARNYSLHVCNWRTGQMISQIDLGTEDMVTVLLDDAYILAISRNYGSDVEPHLIVYDLSPSIPNHPLCAAQLPTLTLNSGERVLDRGMSTSNHPPIPEGHFRADPSMSMVVLRHYIEGPERQEHASYLLIPCAALLTQIRAIVGSARASPHEPPTLVPWTDWGPRVCLRLRAPSRARFDPRYLVPYGSQMPMLVFDDTERTRASVYVFDINPLVARHALHTASIAQRAAPSATVSPAESGEGSRQPAAAATATAVVANVEAALPGVVDAECAAIPFVAYRFPLPLPPPDGPARWASASRISAVRMGMTGFTVTFEGFGPHGEHHTWTV